MKAQDKTEDSQKEERKVVCSMVPETHVAELQRQVYELVLRFSKKVPHHIGMTVTAYEQGHLPVCRPVEAGEHALHGHRSTVKTASEHHCAV